MERYRSGHNEAVLKTVCPKGRVGSNPTLSARLFQESTDVFSFIEEQRSALQNNVLAVSRCKDCPLAATFHTRRSTQVVKRRPC